RSAGGQIGDGSDRNGGGRRCAGDGKGRPREGSKENVLVANEGGDHGSVGCAAGGQEQVGDAAAVQAVVPREAIGVRAEQSQRDHQEHPGSG
ncbi:unnamed protein product, partial [Ectocarpus fasciculatus]